MIVLYFLFSWFLNFKGHYYFVSLVLCID